MVISDDDGASDGDDEMINPSTVNRTKGGIGSTPSARVDSPPRDHGSDEDPDPYGGMSSQEPDTGRGRELPQSQARAEGEYNPAEYDSLNVGNDVKELFQYIGRYKPRPHQLDTKLKCFIPDYIPAVGDIDEFIKVPRPDNKPDFLGLRVLDEPATVQTDPTVLNLQLRQVSKQSGMKPMDVSGIENAVKEPRRIDAWIKSIQELHSGKPPPTMSYSKNMPDIETLMQEWPSEMEELLNQACSPGLSLVPHSNHDPSSIQIAKHEHLAYLRHPLLQVRLPSGNMDIDMMTLTKVFCNLMDIPVYEGKAIESLHVLFTLYLEFKNNPFLKVRCACVS